MMLDNLAVLLLGLAAFGLSLVAIYGLLCLTAFLGAVVLEIKYPDNNPQSEKLQP